MKSPLVLPILLILALWMGEADADATTPPPPKSLAQLLGPILAQAKTRTVRIMMGGTSISASDVSNNQVFVNQLMAMYGNARVAVDRMGIRGGSWDLPTGGWYKQPYSGPSFVRLRGDSASQPLDNPGYGSLITVEYSKESDGGTCQVVIDNVVAGIIDCHGTQQLSVKATFPVPPGTHSVTFLPPASGYIYLERVGFEQGLPGLAVIDGTLGGSGLEYVYSNYPRGGQTVPGVPTQSGTGKAAYFQRADIDFVIWSGPVNDHDGFNPGIDTWKARIDEIVEATRGRCPLIFIAEMGGHLADPNDYAHPIFQAQHDYLVQMGQNNAHVFTLDWHSATVDPNIALYVSNYYPNAVLNSQTGQYGGDFIHPSVVGHRVAVRMLCSSMNIPQPVEESSLLLSNRLRSTSPLPVGTHISFTDGGVQKSGFTTVTGASAYAGASLADTVPVIFSTDATDLCTMNATIAASSTSDKYGKYINYASQVWLPLPGSIAIGEMVTVTALVKSPQPYLLTAFQHPYLDPALYHGTASLGTKTIAITYSDDEPPVWMTFEYLRTSLPYIAFAGKLYCMSITRTNGQPVSSFQPSYTRAATLQMIGVDGLVASGATFHATANPQNDGAMGVSFDYGTEENLADAKQTLNSIVLNSSTDASITMTVQDLAPGRIYFYRTRTTFSGTPEPLFGNTQSFLSPPRGNMTPAIALKQLSNGNALLGMFGLPGQTYTIRASSDLATWTPIATVDAGSSGSFTYEDADAAQFTRRYYRLTQP